ncbi:MAG: pyridoxine 5'-phosphate synthase, partial [Planctomycetaceae bacterium]
VSAFVDPNDAQIEASAKAGCDAVEIHTGAYANTWLANKSQPRIKDRPLDDKIRESLDDIETALAVGLGVGLDVHGGHGLTYNNILSVASMEGFGEFNIGHSIISRAVFTGLRESVAEMKRLIVQCQAGNL